MCFNSHWSLSKYKNFIKLELIAFGYGKLGSFGSHFRFSEFLCASMNLKVLLSIGPSCLLVNFQLYGTLTLYPSTQYRV